MFKLFGFWRRSNEQSHGGAYRQKQNKNLNIKTAHKSDIITQPRGSERLKIKYVVPESDPPIIWGKLISMNSLQYFRCITNVFVKHSNIVL